MIWLNGEPLAGTRAGFDLTDRGLLLGDGVFDTALVIDGAPVWRDAHLRRLCDACAVIGLDVREHDLERRIEAAMTLASAGLAAGSLRVTVTRGPGPRGVAPPEQPAPTVIASHAALTALPAFQPLSLWLSPVRRNETSVTSRIKTLAYLDNVLETGRARAAGCDEPLFLNTRGDVACSGVGNIFALSGGQLLTPPLAAGVLPGIARAALLRLAPAARLVAGEQTLGLDDLNRADAVFVSNSLRLLVPVTRMGDARLRQAPEVFARLRAVLAEAAGVGAHAGEAGATSSQSTPGRPTPGLS